MGFGVDGTSGSNSPRPIGARVKATGASGPEGAPSMLGDSLSLGRKESELAKEVKAMSPEEADRSVSTGGKLIVGGLVGVGIAYWGAAAITAATGVVALPAVIGLAAAGLGLWGAMKVGKGLSAKMNQLMTKNGLGQ